MRRLRYLIFLVAAAVPSLAFSDWDVTTPQGTEAKSQGDDRIREMKVALDDALDFEGDFPGTSSATPRFIYTPSTGTTALRPTGNDAPVGRLFINKSSGVIEQSLGGGNWEAIEVVGSSAVTAGDLAVDVAGPGLSGGGGNPLQVNVDTNTFTITNDTITVTANSIGSTQLADAVSFPTSVNSATYTWQSFGILPILQIQSFTTTTSSASQAGAFENTNLTVTITPKLSTSKILVIANTTVTNGGNAVNRATIARGSTNLGDATNGFHSFNTSGLDQFSIIYLDSPSTTSATTYTLQLKAAVSFPSEIQPNGTTGVIYAIEIAQ